GVDGHVLEIRTLGPQPHADHRFGRGNRFVGDLALCGRIAHGSAFLDGSHDPHSLRYRCRGAAAWTTIAADWRARKYNALYFAEATSMLMTEHAGKCLLQDYGVAVPRGLLIRESGHISRWRAAYPVALKAQVASGGRG